MRCANGMAEAEMGVTGLCGSGGSDSPRAQCSGR